MDLLDDVVRWYSYPGRCRRRRPMRFRRFRMMQVAYNAGGAGGGVGAEQVQQLQKDCEKAANKERGGLLTELGQLRGESINKEGTQAARDGMQVATAFYVTGAIFAGLTLVPVVEWLVRYVWVHRPARRWLQRKFDAKTPQEMYQALCEVGGNARDTWDQWLVDAFLADTDAYYHWWRRLNRSRLPLLLMPEAGPGTSGGDLLACLCHEQVGVTVPRGDSPVVVAHTGGGLHEQIVIVDGLVAKALRGDTAFQTPPPPDQRSAPPPLAALPGPVSTAVSGVVIAALVVAAAVVGPDVMAGVRCGQGVSFSPHLVERDGQCIGVTGGGSGAELMPELAAVSRQIERENAAVGHSSDVATVAYMIPMTPDRTERRQVLNEVKGAYLAQYEANHGRGFGEQLPKTRLVLANPGREYAHWKPVTDQLIAMAHDPAENLRAVTGFNNSGNLYNKAVAIVTLDLAKHSVAFEALAWPKKTPPTDCHVPRPAPGS